VKKYSKKKDKKVSGKNATGPGYRTSDFSKSKMFGGNNRSFGKGFNPGAFKVQHKG